LALRKSSEKRHRLTVYRCAAHYNSPIIPQGLISLVKSLNEMKVYLSKRIFKSMTVIDDGNLIKGKRSTAQLHVDSDESKLWLYFPVTDEEREVCLMSKAPRALMRVLGITDEEAEVTIAAILNNSRVSVVQKVLSERGIIDIDYVGKPTKIEDGKETVQGPMLSPNLDTQSVPPSRPRLFSSQSSLFSRSSSIFDTVAVDGPSTSTSPGSTFNKSPPLAPAISMANTSFFPPQATVTYCDVLDQVITAASGLVFPKCGETGSLKLPDSVNRLVPRKPFFDGRLTEQPAGRDTLLGAAGRDTLLGAAGELLVSFVSPVLF
jgi:hypothetical protein